MNSRILKLASGDFMASKPQMTLSIDRIDETIPVGNFYEGSFSIASANGEPMEGDVYCDNHGIKILTTSFSGLRATISYSVNTAGLKAGDYISGRFFLVCAGDELQIPVSFSVVCDNPGIGDIIVHNTNEFFDLCELDLDSAAAVFASPLFSNIFDRDEEDLKLIYEGLCANGGPTAYAMEEFRIACGRKERVDFKVSEDERISEDVSETIKDYFLISKDGQGMFEIKISSDGDFLKPEKSIITNRDFVGNQCQVSYYVNPEQLHAGRNIGAITVSSPYFSSKVRIEAYRSRDYNPFESGSGSLGKKTAAVRKPSKERSVPSKRYRVDLCRLIIEYLTGHKEIEDFTKRAVTICDEILKDSPGEPWYLLIKAHILVMDDGLEEAKELFNLADTRRLGEEPDLMAYSDLVKYLIYPTVKLSRELSAELRELSVKYPNDSAILYSRLQLDSELARNSARKYDVIRDGILRGADSPFAYMEACRLLADEPYLISEMGDFEVTVLWWGARYDMLNNEVADQVCRFAESRKDKDLRLLKLLMYIADRFTSVETVGALCSYMVNIGAVGPAYSAYYELGIELKVRIPGIYEGYLLSEDTGSLNEFTHEIKLYFRYAQNLPDDKTAMLLSQIIRESDENPIMYSQYQPVIDSFARNMLAKHYVNDDMLPVYEDYFSRNELSRQDVYDLAQIIYTKKLSFDNPSSMPRLVVISPVLSSERIYEVDEPEVYINSPVGNAILLYEDENGKRHAFNDDAVSVDLFAVYKYRALLLQLCPDHPYVLLNNVLANEKSSDICVEDIDRVSALFEGGRVRSSAKKTILSSVLSQCMESEQKETLFKSFIRINTDVLGSAENSQIVETCVKYALYEEALERLNRYSVIEPRPERMLPLCHYAIKEYTEAPYTPVLCAYVVNGGYYDDEVLEYLIDRFEGSVYFFLKLRTAAQGFDIDSGRADERLLERLIYTGIYTEERDEIFLSAIKTGLDETVKLAYFTIRASEYLLEDEEAESVFPVMYSYAERARLNEICNIALLKWLTERKETTQNAFVMMDEILGSLVKKGMYFSFYNDLDPYLKGRYRLQEISIVDHITLPKEGAPVFKYRYEDAAGHDNESFTSVPMRLMIPGFYSVAVPLFPGESVQYYIESAGNDDEGNEFSGSGMINKEAVYYSSGRSRYDLLQNMIAAVNLDEEMAFTKAYEDNMKFDLITEKMFELI